MEVGTMASELLIEVCKQSSRIGSIALLMEFEHNIPGIDRTVFELFFKIFLSFKKIIWMSEIVG